MDFLPAPDIHKQLRLITKKLDLNHIDPARLICFRSHGSTSRARARIWSLPRVWQLGLNLRAHYIIEVISHYFDSLSADDQTRVLIHELMHIPKNFSGALLSHRHGRHHRIDHRSVEALFRQYMTIK
jgi:predicted metallopeptidase